MFAIFRKLIFIWAYDKNAPPFFSIVSIPIPENKVVVSLSRMNEDGSDWQPSKFSKVCGLHFLSKKSKLPGSFRLENTLQPRASTSHNATICIRISFSIINPNKSICFNSSVENVEDFEVLQNNTESTFEIKIHTTMYNGKARNVIIKY